MTQQPTMDDHATLLTSLIPSLPSSSPPSNPEQQQKQKPSSSSPSFLGRDARWDPNAREIVMNFQATHPGSGIAGPDGVATGRGIIIGMLSALGSAVFIVLVFCLVYFLRFTDRGRILLDRVGRPGQYDDEQAWLREEAEALETMDDMQRAEYIRARSFIEVNPPETMQTDISLSQFLAIQEKGVSAWEFEPELEIANCFVEGRTEIEFFDSECTVQSNLPIPKQNEVYYFEAKIYEKAETTALNIGVTTKPYPLFRLPGMHKTSIAYTSTGERRFNQPFKGTAYGPEFVQGDVIGVGYRPRTGTIFFTRNGRKLEDVAHGLKTQNFFPSVGANGPCHIHVNFGQSGFVFIEANVKKWGLAPMTGSLAPPPPYGSEQGSILLEAGTHDLAASSNNTTNQSPYTTRHGRANSRFRPIVGGPTSPGPVRSPTDISLAQLVQVSNEDAGEGTSGGSYVTDNTVPVGLGFQYAAIPDRQPQHHQSPPTQAPQSQSPSTQQDQSQSEDEVEEHDQEAPPPDYESPGSTGTTPLEDRSPPGTPSPPIPSYDAAMAETRDQISEAVSDSGYDDFAPSSTRGSSPAGSERNLLIRQSREHGQ